MDVPIENVQIGDKRDSVLTVRGGDDVKGRPQQKVLFLWGTGVDDEGLASDDALCEWVNVGATFAKSVAAEELAPSKRPRAKGVTKGSKKGSTKSTTKGSTKMR